MKKILLVLLFSFSAAVQAEELKFVTVLSSPVGTFNRVEEVDSNTPVTSPVINFCTKRGSGNVQLNGRGNPAATTLNLASEAELGGNASEYRLQTLTMRYGGTLKGSRLLANTVNANSTPTLIKSSDIYASALNVQGAKTVGLNVGNGKSVMSESGQYTGTDRLEMVWSNEHQQGKTSEDTALYAKQFLLKSKGTEATEPTSYTHEPYTKTVKAAKICGTQRYVHYCGDQSSSTGKDYYYYADQITQTEDMQYQNCNMCQWGVPQLSWAGPVSFTKTTYSPRKYSVQDCPSGYTDAQLCQNNCNPSVQECSFMCLKTPANISGCGREMVRQACLCSCGLKQGEAACRAQHDLSFTCSPGGEDAWKLTYQSEHVYEPLLGGTGVILGCRAAS